MSEKTKIVQCYLPPMVAGKYALSVSQEVKDPEENVIQGDKSFAFGVDAARFTLNPDDIYSVYPPANQFGRFSESFPQVVFSRRTLPWERTIDGQLPAFQRVAATEEEKDLLKTPPTPWMTLLLFDENEMKELTIENRTIADILQTGDDKIIGPEIYSMNTTGENKVKLMEWERTEDGCLTIDITKEQFEKYIPSLESLTYLAHAKEVSIEHKDKNGIADIKEDGTGIFSVIIGNRLPEPGKQHTAILVSLEGYGDYFADAPDKKDFPDDKNKVRLVVLANWQFNTSGDASFKELVDGLEIKSMKINKEQVAPELLPYLDAGYVGLEHLTRIGANTLSWYHGPFLPRFAPISSRSVSFSSADAALRYDKTTGYFDVSFATAWQLGRMLALQNQSFSKAMLSWRMEQKRSTLGKQKMQVFSELLDDESKAPLKNKLINYLGQIPPLEIEMSEHIENENKFIIPEEVQDFLDKLYRLHGVPFPYLVPSELLLEKEHQKRKKKCTGTLAFFYVDPNWIEALLDGALSIGRVEDNEAILDEVMTGGFIKSFINQKEQNPATGKKDISVRILNVTGFLLRSDLISGWRGIEIEAYDSDDKLLPALRFERIDSDVFLGVFNGNVKKIIITQPYEGLHFGIKVDKSKKRAEGKYQKNLKNENGTNQEISDGTADLNEEFKKKIFLNDGVIDVAKVAKKMQQKLKKKGWMNTTGSSKGKYFTSAEFAFQMVDSPVKRTISVKMLISKP